MLVLTAVLHVCCCQAFTEAPIRIRHCTTCKSGINLIQEDQIWCLLLFTQKSENQIQATFHPPEFLLPALRLGHPRHPQLCKFLSCLQPEHHTRDRSCPPLCDTDAAAPPQGPVRWAWAPQTHPRVLFDVVVRTRADLGETSERPASLC